MERFFAFWCKYVAHIPEQEQAFIGRHGKLGSYARQHILVEADMAYPYWVVVLRGMATAYQLNSHGQEVSYWIVLEGDYFTGTKHPYSTQGEGHYIRFDRRSETLELPLAQVRYAQEHLPAFSQLLHVLKQRKQEQQKRLLWVLKEEHMNERFAAFCLHMPELQRQLTNAQAMALLNMSESSYKRARKAYQWRRR